MRWLNLGCGKNWRKYRQYEGLDMVDYGQKYVGEVFSEITKFNEGAFERVMANHFLEHFYPHEVIMLLKEIDRILEKDGIFTFVVPHKDREEAWDLTHKSYWNENTVLTIPILNNAGKWVVDKSIVNDRLDIHAWLIKN